MPAIRHARPEDASAIAAIWNPLIRDTAVTFNNLERTPSDIGRMLADRVALGLPWLVAETPLGVVGFAAYAPFRAGSGYARTMEHSLILAEAATGAGLGAALLARLVAEAEAQRVHALIAAISAENPRALAFHARHGFAEVGRIPEAGRKFERWIDLVLMRRGLV